MTSMLDVDDVVVVADLDALYGSRERHVQPWTPERARRALGDRVTPLYCGVCGFPADMCCEKKKGKAFRKCVPWLLKHAEHLYPKLREQLERERQSKAKSRRTPALPSAPHIPWPSISHFHYVRARVVRPPSAPSSTSEAPPVAPSDVVTYRSKIKLHGTNAAIHVFNHCRPPTAPGTAAGTAAPNAVQRVCRAQSRVRLLSPQSDNSGFCRWMGQNATFWNALRFPPWLHDRQGKPAQPVASSGAAETTAPGGDAKSVERVCVFGEWVGKGIMSGASICTLDHRSFCVFGIQFGSDALLIEPQHIQRYLTKDGRVSLPRDVYVLPWHGDAFDLRMRDEESLHSRMTAINAMVDAIDDRDPWVATTFGIEGCGEGLVWYPITTMDATGCVSLSTFERMVFKTKGASHRVSKMNAALQLHPSVVSSAEEFAGIMLMEPRYEQAIAEACGGRVALSFTNPFLDWLVNDVRKEGSEELAASGLQWSIVEPVLRKVAQAWWDKRMVLQGSVHKNDFSGKKRRHRRRRGKSAQTAPSDGKKGKSDSTP